MTPNQDRVTDKEKVALFNIDAWEHAYYIDYLNVKTDYYKKIWQIINW